MEFTPQLNSRHEQILWATVRHYVATAEPVGSRALTQEFDFNVSPATVRNAMGFLEKSGLLYQPHTSAGRVPSDSGYRLYVDRLMHPSTRLARKVDAQLAEEMDWMNWSLESLLRGVTQILANLSGYLALVTLPQSHTAVIRHVQLVEIDPGQVLMVVLLDALATQSIVIRFPKMAPTSHKPDHGRGRDLEILSNFLTRHLRGCSLSGALSIDWSDISQEFYGYTDMVHQALAELGQRTKSTAPAQLLISGLAEVLRQPEFSESQQVQSIVRLLEAEQSQLWPLLSDEATPAQALQTGGHNVRVWIGSENPIEPMQGCALVLSSYQVGETAAGSVGVLGPTRMMYENAVAVVEATAAHLSDALSEQAD